MTKNPSEPHAGRSAELQRLLEEAARANSPTTPEQATRAEVRQATRSGRRTTPDVHGRPPPAGIGRSVRLAAQRSAEQQHRPRPSAAGPRPGGSSRQLPVSRHTGISLEAARRRALTARLFNHRRADDATAPTLLPPGPPTDHGSPKSADATVAPVLANGGPPAPPMRKIRQRAFVLAAGMAAAVVAVVAIVVGGQVATAPTSDGPPPAPTTANNGGTTVESTSSTRSPAVLAPVTRAPATAIAIATPTPTPTPTSTSTATPTPTPTPRAGDPATVVTGISKLTGWITLAAPHG